jgi:hypothetical protein
MCATKLIALQPELFDIYLDSNPIGLSGSAGIDPALNPVPDRFGDFENGIERRNLLAGNRYPNEPPNDFGIKRKAGALPRILRGIDRMPRRLDPALSLCPQLDCLLDFDLDLVRAKIFHSHPNAGIGDRSGLRAARPGGGGFRLRGPQSGIAGKDSIASLRERYRR